MGQNHNDITSVKIDLQEEAAAIRREFDAANTAGRTRLEYALAAGHRLLTVDEYLKRGPRQKGGLRDWLRQHGFNKSDAYDFMLLARNAETARNSGHSSIHATLQMLRAKVRQLRQVEKIGRFRLAPQQGRLDQGDGPGTPRISRYDRRRFYLHSTKLYAACRIQAPRRRPTTSDNLGTRRDGRKGIRQARRTLVLAGDLRAWLERLPAIEVKLTKQTNKKQARNDGGPA